MAWEMSYRRRLDWLLPDWLENVDAYSQTLNEDMISVYYTILVNVCVFVIAALLYTTIRQYYPKMYAPKADMFPDRVPPLLSRDTYFGWIEGIINIDDKMIIEKGGYDILFLVRFYRLGFKIMAWSSVYCIAVLIPINGTGNPLTDAYSFDRWSMTNIQQQSSRCWFHLLGIYLVSGITFYFLEREFVIYAKYRHIYLRQTHAHLRTVLVEGVPNRFRSPVTLTRYLNALYPNSVLHVKLAQNLKYLDSLIVQRDEVVALLERALYDNHNGHVRPMVRVGNMLNDVDAIRYYSQKLDDLNILITKEQKIAKNLVYKEEGSENKDPRIIDEFLKLTEIGAHRKVIPDSRSIAHSAVVAAASSSAQHHHQAPATATYAGIYSNIKVNHQEEFEESSEVPTSSYQNSGSGGGSYKTVADEADDDSDNEEESMYKTYHMTWREWLWAIWMSPSLMQGWRVIKQGRIGEDFQTEREPGDTSLLIQPPEERRMFLAKAFVTFRTFTAATTARQVVHMQLAGRMSISEAPEPTDVTWSNLYTSRKATLVRRFVVEVAVFTLIIVWIAPVTLLSYVFSKDALSGFFPWVADWCDKSQMFNSIIELFQPLALVGIMNLLPPILTFLAVQEGCIAFSVNQMRSFNRYFTFQIINVFLVTTIAGSFVDAVEAIYNDPASTFELLGSSLPKMGGFFMNLILVKALTGLGMELMRFPALFSCSIKTLFTPNVTPRERNSTPLFGAVRNPHNPGWFPYAKIYAQDMLLFVVSATFACISPLVLLAGMMYYGGAQFVYKHQMMFVYEPIFETGGKWWPKMARCFIIGLLFAQATMVGMMILKETYNEIYFLVLLFALTGFYYYHAVSLYEPLANQLPLDMAMAMDRELANFPDTLEGSDDYLQPSLRAGIVKPWIEFAVDDKKDLTDV